jgi:hypothetical protein
MKLISIISLSSTCIFCGEKNEKFVKEGLELHYWKVCPMLKRCEKCKQVRIVNQIDYYISFDGLN